MKPAGIVFLNDKDAIATTSPHASGRFGGFIKISPGSICFERPSSLRHQSITLSCGTPAPLAEGMLAWRHVLVHAVVLLVSAASLAGRRDDCSDGNQFRATRAGRGRARQSRSRRGKLMPVIVTKRART
jgi:hypothetical protein